MTAATTTPTLAEMTQDVFETNKANGWFEDQRSFGDDTALTHSEVSEMLEAYRDNGFEDMTKDCNVCAKHPSAPHTCKPEGFGSEAADVLVRLLDSAYRWDIVEYLPDALSDVREHARFEPSFTVGTHISILHKLIAQIEILDEVPGVEELLSYLVTWCKYLEIDLQAEFDRKLAFNKTRGHKHGGKLL